MMAWDDRSVDVLRREFDAGLSMSAISRVLATECDFTVTRNAVIGKCHRLGLVRGHDGKRFLESHRGPRARRRVGPRRRTETAPAAPKAERAPGVFSTLDLKADQCRYIEGRPDGNATRYCGAKSVLGSSYCPHHHRLCTQPVVVRGEGARCR